MIQRDFQHLRYYSLAAPPELADFVDSLWYTENHSASAQPFTLLPDGLFKVLLELSAGRPPVLRLSGVWATPRVTRIAAHGTVVGVRFKLMAAEFVCQPLPYNAGLVLPASHWLQPVLLAADLLTVVRQLTVQVTGWQVEAENQRLFAVLDQAAGQWSVQRIAAEVGWPVRQLNRYFHQQFGFSLKRHSDMVRAYTAAEQLLPAALFPQGSYFDQSHGIRQLKKYTGHTPKELLQGRFDRFIQLCPPVAAELCAPPLISPAP